jgi:alpha-glucoside transport system permease protein
VTAAGGSAARRRRSAGVSQPLPAPAAVPATTPPRVKPRSVRERFEGVLFILPALAVLGAFVVYPAYYTTRLAFYQGDFLFHFYKWVGIDNFKQLLTNDPDFLNLSAFHGINIIEELLWKSDGGALINNLHWVVYYISIALILGLGMAALAVRVRYERAVKTAVFIPMAISATAVGTIWLFVYSPNPDIGVLNAGIHAFDRGLHPIAWMGRPQFVNYGLIAAYVWASTGFVMVVLAAAIKGIPAEVMEAARVDGANEWQIFRRVMLPMLSLPISIVTIWLFINVIKVFDIIYVMTGGGPGTSSRVIAFTMYQETFFNGRPGYGAAVAVIMLVLLLPVMILNVRRFRSERVIT